MEPVSYTHLKRYEHMLVLNYSGMEEERMQEVAELLGGVFDSEIAEKRNKKQRGKD